MSTPRRYWIEFDDQEGAGVRLRQGVGVTGFDVPDCLSMVADVVLDGRLPPVRRITVDVSLAEPLPVQRCLGVPVWRGVWHPPVNLGIGPTRAIDRRGAPTDYPPPVTGVLPQPWTHTTLGTKTTWWNEIPHIGHLLSPLVDLHRAESARGMRRRAAEVGDACVRDSAFGHMLREALDFMIAWRPTPEEWFDPTGVRFAEQRELDEYLRAFRDFLFGTRPEPLEPPQPADHRITQGE